METTPHPVATEHLPSFVTPPGQTDVLMLIMVAVLVFSVVGFGVLYFRLHALPEHIAHKGQKLQAELVALLCLISLFTHMHIFWILALVLAFIELPDFGTPLKRIAGSAEKLAGLAPGEGAYEVPRPDMAGHGHESAQTAPVPVEAEPKQSGGGSAPPAGQGEPAASKPREKIHA